MIISGWNCFFAKKMIIWCFISQDLYQPNCTNQTFFELLQNYGMTVWLVQFGCSRIVFDYYSLVETTQPIISFHSIFIQKYSGFTVNGKTEVGDVCGAVDLDKKSGNLCFLLFISLFWCFSICSSGFRYTEVQPK